MRNIPSLEGTTLTEPEFRESLADSSSARRLLHDLGYFGHFLHLHAGGRNGKQHILVKLHTCGGHMTQSELAKNSCVSSASLSEVIAKLEAGGFISRARSQSDGRSLDIALTELGVEKAREIETVRQRFEDEAFACLTDDETQTLLALLDRVADHWHGIESREREEA